MVFRNYLPGVLLENSSGGRAFKKNSLWKGLALLLLKKNYLEKEL